ncbi:MAG: DUF3108 domain-containing protein [Bacteroidota bacterium]
MNKSMFRIGLFALVIVIVAGVIDAQTKKPQTTQKKKPTAAQRAKLKADSIALATVRADSLQKALRVQAIKDSTRAFADSLAREDSLKSTQLRKIDHKAFGVGEKLVFDVNWKFVNAGEAIMWVPKYDSIAGRKCYKVEFQVNSNAFISSFYKVEDRYYTFIDVETIAPWRFEQHIREGTYRRDFIAEFDQRRHVAKTTEGEYPIAPYVHDIMSAFYYARTLDYSNLKIGEGPLLHNFYKDKSHELRVKFLGRQEIEVLAGKFKTVVVEPMVREGGLFKSEGRIVIWLTDDERKIPVRVNTKVLIGSIDVELREYSGLIGPLGAKIEED